VTLAETSKADPKAVAVARAVYHAVRPEKVILFGSRARGDYRPDSDIDLLIVSDDSLTREGYMNARKVVMEAATRIYGDYFGANLVWMPRGKYMECRKGINHVAAQAARDGVDMNGEKEEYERDVETTFDWADVRQRVINANRELIALEWQIEGDMPQEVTGFHAQQTLENILKAWISAFGGEYGNTHDLGSLMRIIRSNSQENETPAGEELVWLTEYAVEYRYEGAQLVMDDPIELYLGIDRMVSAVEERIKVLTGVEELPRYTPPTRRRDDQPESSG
jgi:HEPN domain-containing protein/predicted nucleotidyltransferase